MNKKYIQYDKITGVVLATTSGKMRMVNGRREVEPPTENDMPENVGILEVNATDDTDFKRINLNSMALESTPKTALDLFEEAWPYAKIIQYVQTGNGKRKEFIDATNAIKLSDEV